MKKKLFFMFISVWSFSLGFCAMSVSAGTYGDLTYTVSNGEITITDCNTSVKSVEIPERIGEYVVTTIGNDAFWGCKSLTNVIIPNTISSIGEYAFNNCKSLTSINIPHSVVSIGRSAFFDCISLKSIDLGNGVKVIGRHAFHDCSSLISVTLPDNITTIGDSAFRNCSGLEKITIPNTITEIDDSTFYCCSSLMNVELGNSVRSINSSAFSGCISLTTITIPKSVEYIGEYAFNYCTNISNVYYEGNSDEWSQITVRDKNTSLTRATRFYNYNMSKTYTFVTNGGSEIESIQGEISTSPITTKKDYKFLGWYANEQCVGEKISFPYSGTKTTLYAKWIPIVYTTTSIMSETVEKTIFKVVPINVENGKSIIFASYDDGQLTHCDSLVYYGEESLYFELDNNIKYNITKVFVWNSLSSLMPLNTEEVFCEKSEKEGDHNLSTIEIELLPTCTTTGKYKERACQKCGKIFKGMEIAALGHTEIVDTVVAPTCTKTGLTEGKHCSVCNATIVKQNVIPPLPHTEIKDKRIEPTCTSVGYDGGSHCSVCGFVIKESSVISRISHTEVADKRIEPTCTTVGYDGGTHCSVCGSVVKEQVEIPALGHTEVIISAVTPTCIKTGLTDGKYCSVCDAIIVLQQELAKVPHSIKNGSCTYCFASEDVLKSEELVREAERHKAKVDEINGWYAWVVELNQSRINELKSAHNITYVYDNITCVQEINSLNSQISSLNYQISKLEMYNDPADWAEIASLKSQKSSLELKKAKYEAMKDINAYEQTLLSHQDTYNERINAENSLYESNKNLITLKYNNDPSICSNHTWGEWECVSEASCLAVGVNTRYCSVCALVDNEIISKLNHELVIDAYVAPTCTKTGLTEGSHCSLCKTVFVEQKTISKTSHWYKSCKCKYCGLIDYEATFDNLKSHIMENGTKVDEKTYCLELGRTIDEQQYATYTYIRKNYYNIDNNTITLSVDVLADSVWTWKIDITVPLIDGIYQWRYLDEVDAYMDGTLNASSFTKWTSSLPYSNTNITSSQITQIREMAAYFVDLLCSNMKYDYLELGFTQEHLGFSKY